MSSEDDQPQKKKKKLTPDDIVPSDELTDPFEKKSFNCDQQKILAILAKASKEAQQKKVKAVIVKGKFTAEEKNFMRMSMKMNGYCIHETIEGFVFVPEEKKKNSFGNDNSGFNFGGTPQFGGFNFGVGPRYQPGSSKWNFGWRRGGDPKRRKRGGGGFEDDDSFFQ